jgi:hypothetical protein
MSKKDKEAKKINDLFNDLSGPILKGKLTINYSFSLNGKEHTIIKSIKDPYYGVWTSGDDSEAYLQENMEDIPIEELKNEVLKIFQKEIKKACFQFDEWEEKYHDDFYKYLYGLDINVK